MNNPSSAPTIKMVNKKNILYGPAIPKHILESKSNLSQYFIRLLGQHGNRIAMVDVHDNSEVTFNGILNTSLNIASWLKYECGVQKSNVVGIFSENTIWYPAIMLAVWHVGGICALFNPSYNKQELLHVLNISKPKIMITSKSGLNAVRQATNEIDCVKYICPIDTIINLKNTSVTSSFVPVNYDNSHTCVLLCSSGTTGLPKCVELTHKTMLLMTDVLNYMKSFVNEKDVLMGLVPMYHGYGVLVMNLCMSIGSKTILIKFFEGNLYLKSIEDYKITVLFAVPPLMVYLAKSPLVNKYNLSSIRVIYSGAAPLSQDIEIEVAKKIGKGKSIEVQQGYGMTELSILATCADGSNANNKPLPGAVGNVMYGMLAKVIDLDTGKPLGPFKSGELCFKGPMVMKGYYNNSEETSNIIDQEGWLHTGDVGYYDKYYNFYIVDRIKELIKYKGYQVAPAELESVLLTHPDIEDAAVTGLPNPIAGELPIAFVVKAKDSKLGEMDVVEFINKQVSSQKRLRGGVRFVDVIPKNPSGKILRKVLKSMLNKSKI
ncbi:uncharacterized protein LOC126844403 isoform X2 [Adelges cooleyi]|uniref:uncharacterized protein LOC126844403 isoform X2 n=1 Tax=Adelges cooleyi TaxID=133065 RepID=UPI00217F773F|nr:uncharacterized protein LOC126844403 isoform X2 [Adelges cooleyi]